MYSAYVQGTRAAQHRVQLNVQGLTNSLQCAGQLRPPAPAHLRRAPVWAPSRTVTPARGCRRRINDWGFICPLGGGLCRARELVSAVRGACLACSAYRTAGRMVSAGGLRAMFLRARIALEVTVHQALATNSNDLAKIFWLAYRQPLCSVISITGTNGHKPCLPVSIQEGIGGSSFELTRCSDTPSRSGCGKGA